MSDPVLKKIEETYLKIFRIVLLIVLTIILIATMYIAGQGLMKLMESPKPVEPAKTAPPPDVSVEKFLERFDEKPVNDPPPRQTTSAPQKKDTTLDDKVSAQIRKLWAHYDKYQEACRIDPDVRADRQTFEENLNRQVLRNLLQELGDQYFSSQDMFEKMLLESPRAIQICIEKEGRPGIFFTSLNWHQEQWREQKNAADEFNALEKQRFENETNAEELRVAATKVAGTAQLVLAAQIFAAFMALALLLIFAKIESNLRGVQVIEKGPVQPVE
jgi:hypothetical protein